MRTRAASEIADEQLVAWFHETGDQRWPHLLIDRYRPRARAKARRYYVAGGDRQDVEQEALIGLWHAVRAYRPGRNLAFAAFAELCMARQIQTAIRDASRSKHVPLNASRPLSDPGSGSTTARRTFPRDAPWTLADTDPGERVVVRATSRSMWGRVSGRLSSFEAAVLALHLDGCSYAEMADELGRELKAVDNALRRARAKACRALGGVVGTTANDLEPEARIELATSCLQDTCSAD